MNLASRLSLLAVALTAFSGVTSAHARGKSGLVLTGYAGYTALRNGPLAGGKEDTHFFSGEIGFQFSKGENRIESGIYGDYREVLKAGDGEVSGLSGLGVYSRILFARKGGFFLDVRADLPSWIFAALTRDASASDAALRGLGFGFGIGYRIPLGDTFYVSPRIAIQSFKVSFPIDPGRVDARTVAYEGQVGITTAF